MPSPLMFLPMLLALLLWPAASPAIEQEPVLSAAELLEPSLLAGPGYRVQPRAELRGLQARFWVDTDWGGFPVDSVELLAQRVAEMPALQALHQQTIVDLLADTGIDALRQPARALVGIASDPLGAAARVPDGLLRYFRARLQKIGDRARKLGERLDRAVFHDGAPGELPPASTTDGAEPWWDRPADEFARLLRSQAGHGKARRELAAAFGVDPATGNPLLRERLDQLAWAVAAGRLSTDRLITLASAGASTAIGHIEQAASISAVAPEEDLRRQASERLLQWTADDDLAYALAWRGALPPPRLLQLLDLVDALQPTAGVEALLDCARLADNELEARFVVNTLQMLLADTEHVAIGGRLLPAGALVGYLRGDGEYLLPLPVDRLSWTAEVQDWFDDLRVAGHDRRTVLVAGSVSRRATRELARRGWSLRAQHRWPGSPPYRRPGSAA